MICKDEVQINATTNACYSPKLRHFALARETLASAAWVLQITGHTGGSKRVGGGGGKRKRRGRRGGGKNGIKIFKRLPCIYLLTSTFKI